MLEVARAGSLLLVVGAVIMACILVTIAIGRR